MPAFLFVLMSACSLAVAPLMAQSSKDSLAQLIKTLPEDTTKLDVYFSYGFLLEDENLDSAAHYYRKAAAISSRFNHVKGTIRFINNYTFILNLQGRLEESFKLTKEAYRLAKDNGLKLETAKVLVNMANVHNHRGEYDSAVTYYLEAVELFERMNNRDYLHVLYQNIGTAFDSMEQFEKAIEYGSKAIEYSKQVKDSITLVAVLSNVAGSYSSLRHYDSALTLLHQAAAIGKRTGYKHGYQTALINMGNAYAKKKVYAMATSCFAEALEIAEEMSFPPGRASALNGLAMTSYFQGKYKEADRYAMKGLAISEANPVVTDLRQQYKLLADIKSKLNRPAEALQYLTQYVTLNDSLAGYDVKKITANLERLYQLAQKDKALAQQELKIQQAETHIREKNLQVLILVISLALTIAIFILLYRFYRQRQKLQKKEVAVLQQQQEVIRLRATLAGQHEERVRIAKEIHDEIGSGLTTLVFLTNAFPKTEEYKKTYDKLTGLARQMVNQMNEIVWSLNSEQDTLEDLVVYIRHSISEMANAATIHCEFSIPAAIPSWSLTGIQRRNIYLVIKEAVHNAVKHANASAIYVAMDFSEKIWFQVRDDGQGMNTEGSRFGNGLKNMQYRMQQIGGEWKLVETTPVTIEISLRVEHTL